MTPECFLELARVLPEPLCLVSGDGKLLACNAPAEAILGASCEELREVPLAELTTDPIDKVRHYLRLCSGSRELCLGSLTLRAKTGEVASYRCEGAALQPRSGDTPSLILLRLRPKASAGSRFLLLNEKIDALAREVRVRRRAEEEAQEQRERLKVTLASIGDGVVATDADGAVTFMNYVAESLTGWRDEEALGRPLQEVFRIVNEVTREEVESPVDKTLREGVIVGLANHTLLIARDQTERPIDDSGAPIRDQNGKIIGAVLVFRDVSERRRAEKAQQHLIEREKAARARAEEASRLKDEFLATVSHELRTPLNSILGWVRILRGGRLDGMSSAKGLEIIERSARSQNALIEDILDVSRIITGRLRLDLQTVDVSPIIEAALDSVRPTAEAKGVRLSSKLSSDAGSIAGDPHRIQQIVWNLISNAIKFTPRGQRVEVSLARINSEVEIKVSDTGVGIRKEFLPFVFDRFRQEDSSSSRQYGGLGLGLAIVRHLVELHGGEVSAESPGEGQGATFKVRLPVRRPRQDVMPLEGNSRISEMLDSSGVSFDLRGLRILVVDDDETTRDLLTTALTLTGAVVQAAVSAAEALVILDEWSPQILVSDIGMPVEDGYTLIRKVRAREARHGGQIPAVALTAYAKSEDRLRVLSAGYQMHVPKPIDPTELAAVIASLAGRLNKTPFE